MSGRLVRHSDRAGRPACHRLEERPGHFMPASLLRSQLATLEPLEPGEAGIMLTVEEPPDALVNRITLALD
jgi:gluconokinase